MLVTETLAQPTASLKVKLQRGFTLIELIVVLVIMGVVVSVGVISLGSFNQDLAENQRANIQSLLQQVADQSAFSQKLFLITPDESGLTTYWLKDKKWQVADTLSAMPWQAGFKVDWDVDENLTSQQKLPDPGWLFWPSGEVIPGEIVLTGVSDNSTSLVVTLSWNEALEFEKQ